MKIVYLQNNHPKKSLEITATLSPVEFERLRGGLDNIGVFAADDLTVPASVIRTGSRHHRVKYLLFPSSLRQLFQAQDYDFSTVSCGTSEDAERLYIIYRVPKKAATTTNQDSRNGLLIPDGLIHGR